LGVKYPDMPKLKQYAKDEKIAPGPVILDWERNSTPMMDDMPVKGPKHDAAVKEALENIYPVK
jgi:hypothetical protein